MHDFPINSLSFSLRSEAQKYLRKVDQINLMTNCKSTEEFNQLARSLLVVASTPPTIGYEKFTSQVRNHSSMPPFNFKVPELFSVGNYSKVSSGIKKKNIFLKSETN